MKLLRSPHKTAIARIAPYILLIFCSIYILGANPFNGETVAPTDIIANQSGWQNLSLDVPLRNPARTDILDARLPRWLHAKNSIRDGEIPIWNPYPINGIPGIQWLPASIITPAFGVFLAIEDDATGYYFAQLTNLIIAAIGSYLLLYQLCSNRSASVFGAIVYTFCGFHAAWFFWAHVLTSIWIPWLLFLTLRYLQTQRLIYLPWITITTSLMIFGGFPSIVVYAFIALGIFSLKYTPWQTGIKPALQSYTLLAIAICFALVISLFSIQSLSEMLEYTGTIGRRVGGTSLRYSELLSYVIPSIISPVGVEHTIYVGILPLVFAGIAPFFLKEKNNRTSILFSFIILAISISISFAILPKSIIESIPTFKSNNWGRMMILAALAFSIISAVSLTQLSSIIQRKTNFNISMGIAALFIAIQIFDIKAFFENFNGPVPDSTFFPKTPTIEFLQSSVAPLQSVIADRSYQLSGILTNYSLPEWFAHGFRTEAEMAILNSEIAPDSHPSPTAAAVYCENINYNSDYLTLLGIKYIACGDISTSGIIDMIFYKTEGERQLASKPIPPNSPLKQYFNIPKPVEFDAIFLQLATYGRETSHTDVTVSFFTDNDLLESAKLDAALIHDNEWVKFTFPNPIRLEQGAHRLEISTAQSDSEGKLSVWLYTQNNDAIYVEQNNLTQNAIVAAKLAHNIYLPDSIVAHRIEDNMVMLENTRVQGSGYTLPVLDRTAIPDFDHTLLKESSETGYRLSYSGKDPAWLVLPIRSYPQWHTYINGKQVAYENFLGILPAVRVSQGDEVSYRYEPNTLYFLVSISLSALLFTLYLAFRWRKK